jgi:hypothetical protein
MNAARAGEDAARVVVARVDVRGAVERAAARDPARNQSRTGRRHGHSRGRLPRRRKRNQPGAGDDRDDAFAIRDIARIRPPLVVVVTRGGVFQARGRALVCHAAKFEQTRCHGDSSAVCGRL